MNVGTTAMSSELQLAKMLPGIIFGIQDEPSPSEEEITTSLNDVAMEYGLHSQEGHGRML